MRRACATRLGPPGHAADRTRRPGAAAPVPRPVPSPAPRRPRRTGPLATLSPGRSWSRPRCSGPTGGPLRSPPGRRGTLRGPAGGRSGADGAVPGGVAVSGSGGCAVVGGETGRAAAAAAGRTEPAGAAAGGAGGRGTDRRGAAPDLTELLPQWLATALRQGFAAPHDLLPALLDAARARTDLRPAALAFAGPRALWLARLNPAWRFALRGVPGGAAGTPAPEDAEGVARLWEEGLFAERVALLGTLRERDPARARELLATTWRTERAEDRLLFLDSLRAGLGEADETFLDEALADRSRNVRSTAAELLSALPGSALATRMAERAASCVSLALTGEPRITVEAPHECDAGMERDGVTAKPPANRGERSWWFGQLVEAAPLATW